MKNRGPTISTDKLASVFDPMVRIAANVSADYTERTSLGIGLFISREVVKAHGGRIAVASSEEEARRLP